MFARYQRAAIHPHISQRDFKTLNWLNQFRLSVMFVVVLLLLSAMSGAAAWVRPNERLSYTLVALATLAGALAVAFWRLARPIWLLARLENRGWVYQVPLVLLDKYNELVALISTVDKTYHHQLRLTFFLEFREYVKYAMNEGISDTASTQSAMEEIERLFRELVKIYARPGKA